MNDLPAELIEEIGKKCDDATLISLAHTNSRIRYYLRPWALVAICRAYVRRESDTKFGGGSNFTLLNNISRILLTADYLPPDMRDFPKAATLFMEYHNIAGMSINVDCVNDNAKATYIGSSTCTIPKREWPNLRRHSIYKSVENTRFTLRDMLLPAEYLEIDMPHEYKYHEYLQEHMVDLTHLNPKTLNVRVANSYLRSDVAHPNVRVLTYFNPPMAFDIIRNLPKIFPNLQILVLSGDILKNPNRGQYCPFYVVLPEFQKLRYVSIRHMPGIGSFSSSIPPSIQEKLDAADVIIHSRA